MAVGLACRSPGGQRGVVGGSGGREDATVLAHEGQPLETDTLQVEVECGFVRQPWSEDGQAAPSEEVAQRADVLRRAVKPWISKQPTSLPSKKKAPAPGITPMQASRVTRLFTRVSFPAHSARPGSMTLTLMRLRHRVNLGQSNHASPGPSLTAPP